MTYYYDSLVAIMVRFDLQPYVEAEGSGLAEHRELGTCARPGGGAATAAHRQTPGKPVEAQA